MVSGSVGRGGRSLSITTRPGLRIGGKESLYDRRRSPVAYSLTVATVPIRPDRLPNSPERPVCTFVAEAVHDETERSEQYFLPSTEPDIEFCGRWPRRTRESKGDPLNPLYMFLEGSVRVEGGGRQAGGMMGRIVGRGERREVGRRLRGRGRFCRRYLCSDVGSETAEEPEGGNQCPDRRFGRSSPHDPSSKSHFVRVFPHRSDAHGAAEVTQGARDRGSVFAATCGSESSSAGRFEQTSCNVHLRLGYRPPLFLL